MKAFPIVIDRETQLAHEMESAITEEGMDLRDYFAAKALVIVASQYPSTSFIGAAEIAYDYADALIKVRSYE